MSDEVLEIQQSDRQSMSDINIRCYHEAAHAVVARPLGWTVVEVCTDGTTIKHNDFDRNHPYQAESNLLWHRMIVSQAGSLGSMLLGVKSDYETQTCDKRDFERFFAELVRRKQSRCLKRHRFQRAARYIAATLIKRNEICIERIAKELIKDSEIYALQDGIEWGRLSGDSLDQLLADCHI